jgi:hypothetical protein
MLDRITPSPYRGMIFEEDSAIDALSDVDSIAILCSSTECIADIATAAATSVWMHGISPPQLPRFGCTFGVWYNRAGVSPSTLNSMSGQFLPRDTDLDVL